MLKALALCLFAPVLHAQTASPDQIRSAAKGAVAVVQRGSAGFYKFMDCFSCHDHGLPMLTLRRARERGIAVDEPVASQVAAKGLLATPDLSSIDRSVQYPMIVDPAVADGWALIAAHAAGVQPNLITGVYARRVANWQRRDGHWPTVDVRPPQSYSLFTATAVALRAMQLYMPGQLRQEVDKRGARAKPGCSRPSRTIRKTSPSASSACTGGAPLRRNVAAPQETCSLCSAPTADGPSFLTRSRMRTPQVRRWWR